MIDAGPCSIMIEDCVLLSVMCVYGNLSNQKKSKIHSDLAPMICSHLGNSERQQLTISIKDKKANRPLTANFLSRAILSGHCLCQHLKNSV